MGDRWKEKPKPLAPTVMGTDLCWHGSPLDGRVTANLYKVALTDLLYPKMKHFCPDGSSVLLTMHPSTRNKESLNN